MEKQTKSLDCGRHFDFPGGGRVAKYRSFCSHNISRKSHGNVPVNSIRFRNDVQKIGLGGTLPPPPPNYHMRVNEYIKTISHHCMNLSAASVHQLGHS